MLYSQVFSKLMCLSIEYPLIESDFISQIMYPYLLLLVPILSLFTLVKLLRYKPAV